VGLGTLEGPELHVSAIEAIEDAKKLETRARRIEHAVRMIAEAQKRP
jgi:uncharacterized protein YdeI (YjbR/CyaY-like superfamily)